MPPDLSPRQIGVLNGYMRGDSVSEIATAMGLTGTFVTRIANRLRDAGYQVPLRKSGAANYYAREDMAKVSGRSRRGGRITVYSMDRADALAELIGLGGVPDGK